MLARLFIFLKLCSADNIRFYLEDNFSVDFALSLLVSSAAAPVPSLSLIIVVASCL